MFNNFIVAVVVVVVIYNSNLASFACVNLLHTIYICIRVYIYLYIFL